MNVIERIERPRVGEVLRVSLPEGGLLEVYEDGSCQWGEDGMIAGRAEELPEALIEWLWEQVPLTCSECEGEGVVEEVPYAGTSICDPARVEEVECSRCAGEGMVL